MRYFGRLEFFEDINYLQECFADVHRIEMQGFEAVLVVIDLRSYIFEFGQGTRQILFQLSVFEL